MNYMMSWNLVLVLALAGCVDMMDDEQVESEASRALNNAMLDFDSVSGESTAAAFSHTSEGIASLTNELVEMRTLVGSCSIGYDMSHNTSRQDLTRPDASDSLYRNFWAAVRDAGFTVTEFTSFSPATLSQFDVIWMEEDFDNGLSASERGTLSDAVSGGAGVITCCEDWEVANGPAGSPNDIFGYRYSFPGLSGISTEITADAVTEGVFSISFPGSARSLSLPTSATSLVRRSGAHGVAISQFGAGRVVILSDEIAENNRINLNDNLTLLRNALEYACAPSNNTPEVLMDNHKHDEIPVGVSFTGDWPEASSATGSFGVAGRYAETGGETNTYRFTPEFSGAGNYRVQVWNNCFAPRAANVPHTIMHADGATTIEVDQDCSSGSHSEWLELGTFAFASGTDGYVEISDAGLAAGLYIGADGARFIREDVIIIDNGEAGTASIGQWNEALAATENYQLSSVFAESDSAAVQSYRFTPNLPQAGNYVVEVWNSCFSPRASNVPHSVAHSGGTTTLLVDQDCTTGSHGEWLELGVFNFAAGSSGYVEISTDGVPDYAYVGADAARFFPAP